MKHSRWSSVPKPWWSAVLPGSVSHRRTTPLSARALTRGLTAAVSATVFAWALISPSAATAETPTPDPSSSPVVAQALVLPIEGEVRDLTFPTANLDGSVTEDGTVITLKADVFFEYNKATLNGRASTALDRAVARLQELGATAVTVAGYTDSKGTAAYNRGLSLRRAQAVRAGLAARLPDLKQAVRGYGESRAVASNHTAKGRALNRRVTITVTG